MRMLGWGRRKPTQEDYRDKFRSRYFADIPVDLERVGEFRADALPEAAPIAGLMRRTR